MSDLKEVSARERVEGGKFLQVSVLVKGGRKIEDLTLTGDFFMFPGSDKKTIEKALCGRSVEKSINELSGYIDQSLPADTELLGFDSSDVAELVKGTLEDGK